MSEKYSKSLLILDDVWSVDIVRAFNVSTRVLLTTRDVSVVDVVSKQDQQIVEIQSGFTEAESLEVCHECRGCGGIQPVFFLREFDLCLLDAFFQDLKSGKENLKVLKSESGQKLEPEPLIFCSFGALNRAFKA